MKEIITGVERQREKERLYGRSGGGRLQWRGA